MDACSLKLLEKQISRKLNMLFITYSCSLIRYGLFTAKFNGTVPGTIPSSSSECFEQTVDTTSSDRDQPLSPLSTFVKTNTPSVDTVLYGMVGAGSGTIIITLLFCITCFVLYHVSRRGDKKSK